MLLCNSHYCSDDDDDGMSQHVKSDEDNHDSDLVTLLLTTEHEL